MVYNITIGFEVIQCVIDFLVDDCVPMDTSNHGSLPCSCRYIYVKKFRDKTFPQQQLQASL
jgi:hypothetical protein